MQIEFVKNSKLYSLIICQFPSPFFIVFQNFRPKIKSLAEILLLIKTKKPSKNES